MYIRNLAKTRMPTTSFFCGGGEDMTSAGRNLYKWVGRMACREDSLFASASTAQCTYEHCIHREGMEGTCSAT